MEQPSQNQLSPETQNQPTSTPPPKLPKKSYLSLILAVIIIFAISIFGGVTLGKFLYGPQTVAPIPTLAPKPTLVPTAIPTISTEATQTADWKTFKDSFKDINYSFKYPSDFYYSKASTQMTHFYQSQEEADKQKNCFDKNLGTFEKPCSYGLFDVAINRRSSPQEKSLREQASLTLSDKEISSFQDQSRRNWTIVGPIYGLGGSQTDIEVTENNYVYGGFIHVWDDFIKPTDNAADYNKKCLVFIDQILSTFKFTE